MKWRRNVSTVSILLNAHYLIDSFLSGLKMKAEAGSNGYVVEELTVPSILERLEDKENLGKIKAQVMYTYMSASIQFLDWGLVQLKESLHKWAVLKDVMRLPQSVLDELMITKSQGEFYAKFVGLPHASWFDLHLYEAMCIDLDQDNMGDVVDCFKAAYYKAKLRDVHEDIPRRKLLPGYTLIHEKYHRNPDDLTIYDLKDHQQRLEVNILGLPLGTMVVCYVLLFEDSLQAGWLIPKKTDKLVYMNMCKNFEKLAGEGLTYLEVGGFQSISVPVSLATSSSPENDTDDEANGKATTESSSTEASCAVLEINGTSLLIKNRRLGQVKPTPQEFRLWEGLPVLPCGAVVKQVGPMQLEPDTRQEPYPLPSGFVWESLDIDDRSIFEEVVTFACPNSTYQLSQYRLDWLLHRPGWCRDWMVGIRVVSNKRLVGMICGIPSKMVIGNETLPVVLFRYIRVHKKYGGKRMEYMLVREIMRRANQAGYYQGIIFQPQTILHCVFSTKSWQYSLTQRVHIHQGYILSEVGDHFRVPRFIKTPGLRKIRRNDLPKAFKFVNEYLSQFFIHPVFDDEETFEYVFMTRPRTITTYVVVDKETGDITDMFSFMLSWIIFDQTSGDYYYEASMYYFFSTVTPQKQLVIDALVLAKNDGCDSFQAIDIPIDNSIFHELNFLPGNTMYMSLYNYQCPELPTSEVYCPSL